MRPEHVIAFNITLLAALVGLDAIFTLLPWSYVLVKIVGGLYLSYLA